MQFIDHTGHIFSQASYNVYPTGYEYEKLLYNFWLDSEVSSKLSVGNYYMLPIRPVVSNQVKSVKVSIDSDIFKLVASNRIQDQHSLTIELSENSDDFKSTLYTEDICLVSDGEYTMTPFYVIGKSDIEGTFLTNILITIEYEDVDYIDYCPISVAGTWIDENEILSINAENLGVSIPRSVIKAIYQGSIINDKLDTVLYNDKIREYLLNFMSIKGECGNTNSVINSLNWFGYGDKVKLTQLIKTDNELLNQYIHDNLSVTNDIISGFKNFVNTAFFSLVIPENSDIEAKPFNFDEDFYGENNPETESLFNKLVENRYDEQDIAFYKPYYDYTLQEMAIKLSYLKYYMEKYFMPIHSGLYSASIQHKEYCNDIKFVVRSFNKITSNPTQLTDNRVNVEFPKNHEIYFYSQSHYIDDNYNEFTDSKWLGNNTSSEIYYTNEVCFSIPIKFTGSDYYNCKLIIERDDNKLVLESEFKFAQSEEHDYNSLVVLPRLLNKYLDINYWLNYSYILHICVNDKWFSFPFTLNIPELNISFGTLEYEYNYDNVKQINGYSTSKKTVFLNSKHPANIETEELDLYKLFVREEDSYYDVKFNAFMYLPRLVQVENIRFPQNIIDYGNSGQMLKFIKQYKEGPMLSSNQKFYNRVHYFKLLDNSGRPVRYYEGEDLRIYSHFFNEDGTYKPVIANLFKDCIFHYDFYLMHDSANKHHYEGILSKKELEKFEPAWYGVFISKETIDKKIKDSDLDIRNFIGNKRTDIIEDSTYVLKYEASDNKFLINRMKFKSSEGSNIFNIDDIIVANVNNIDLPFVLELGSHWNFKPFSLGMKNSANVGSNTNTAIISMGGDNSHYERGYYDVNVRFSLDANSQEQITKTARILIQ